MINFQDAMYALVCGTPAAGGDRDIISFDTSTQSKAMAVGVYRLSANQDCWYAIGANPTASTDDSSSSAFLKAGTIDYVAIPDATYKVAAIKDSTAGTLSIQQVKVVA